MRVGGFTGYESVVTTAKRVTGESLFTTACVGSLYRFGESAYATIKCVGGLHRFGESVSTTSKRVESL